MTGPVEFLPDHDFKRVLCVVAHPDDNEYGTSAAVARWTGRGIEVASLLLTAGEAGMQRPPAEAGPLRAAEQRDACNAVGVRDLTILDYPDGVLEYSLAMRRDIARRIRQFRPDVVVTGTWAVEAPYGLNQSDHRAVGLATLDAIRDADNTWVFPELAQDEGLPKWGVTWFLVNGDPNPTHAVDVTGEPLECAIASLEAHRAYLADLAWHPAPRDMLTESTEASGTLLGVHNVVQFRAHRLRA